MSSKSIFGYEKYIDLSSLPDTRNSWILFSDTISSAVNEITKGKANVILNWAALMNCCRGYIWKKLFQINILINKIHDKSAATPCTAICNGCEFN